MKVSPLGAVECAILHDDFTPLPAATLFAWAEQIGRDLGIRDDLSPMVTSTETDAHMMFGDIRVLISQSPTPLGARGFERALQLDWNKIQFPEADRVVARHRAYTFVTVGKGAIDLSQLGEMATFLVETSPEHCCFTDRAEVDLALAWCRRLALQIQNAHAATALHWCMNDILMKPAHFELVAKVDASEMLGILPIIFRDGPGQPVTAIGFGSDWLVGKLVAFVEESAPIEYLIEHLWAFSAMCGFRGALLPDGDNYSREGENELIHIQYCAGDRHVPRDYIRLSIRKCEKYGIDLPSPPQLKVQYNPDGGVKSFDESGLPPSMRDDPRIAAELARRRAELSGPTTKLDLARYRTMASIPLPTAQPQRSFLQSVMDRLLRR